jgi:hypothetical protein
MRNDWNGEVGMRNKGGKGIRPPASPSCRLYEPEAIGAYAYAPAGMGKLKGVWNGDRGKGEAGDSTELGCSGFFVFR